MCVIDVDLTNMKYIFKNTKMTMNKNIAASHMSTKIKGRVTEVKPTLQDCLLTRQAACPAVSLCHA